METNNDDKQLTEALLPFIEEALKNADELSILQRALREMWLPDDD